MAEKKKEEPKTNDDELDELLDSKFRVKNRI
jgi:hypothetical protein